MKYIEGESREQKLLLPERLDDYVEADNPVRFIEAFVEKLNLAACGIRRSEANDRGRLTLCERIDCLNSQF